MIKLVQYLYALAAILFLSGCATSKIEMAINSYSDMRRGTTSNATVHVVTNPESQNTLLDQEIKKKVEAALILKGIEITEFENADYIISFSYALGSRKVTDMQAVYTPDGEVATGFWDGVAKGMNSTRMVPIEKTVFDRSLTVYAVDGKTLRAKEEVDVRWLCETMSSGSGADIRILLTYMLVPTFDWFGRSTGQIIEVSMHEDDERAQFLLTYN